MNSSAAFCSAFILGVPHDHFFKKKMCRHWPQRHLYHSVFICLFLKEEEGSTEGRDLSSRSTENLPFWGLGAACHAYEKTVSRMSETPWANRKVSSKGQSQKIKTG